MNVFKRNRDSDNSAGDKTVEESGWDNAEDTESSEPNNKNFFEGLIDDMENNDMSINDDLGYVEMGSVTSPDVPGDDFYVERHPTGSVAVVPSKGQGSSESVFEIEIPPYTIKYHYLDDDGNVVMPKYVVAVVEDQAGVESRTIVEVTEKSEALHKSAIKKLVTDKIGQVSRKIGPDGSGVEVV